MTTIRPTRRSVTKGAVWSVPAVAAVSAAPAYATSLVPCPTTACVVHTVLSAPTFTVTAQNGNVFSGQSRVNLNLGDIYINSACAPAGTTGFRFQINTVTGYDQAGVAHTGTNLLQNADSPYVLGAGGAMWVRADFMDFAYNAPGPDPDWSSSHYLMSYTITYTVTFLRWLTGTTTYEPHTGPCAYSTSIVASPNLTYIGGGLTKFN